MTVDQTTPPVDAILVLSFGGPEKPDDVMPFLRNVTMGRNVPDERLAEVAEQYHLFGGRSPINEHGRSLSAALGAALTTAGHDLPVYFGNRNWHPFVADTVASMATDGVKKALVFVPSAFGSYSGCRQYQEDLLAARGHVGEQAPQLDKLRLFYNHPGFIEPLAANLVAARSALSQCRQPRIVFTAHSIPTSMAAGCDYEGQLIEAAGLVMERSGINDVDHDLVFQSRSGPPQMPWLEPDINDHLELLAAQGTDGVFVIPLGFTSDHMEVMFDLDTQAAQTADRLGLAFKRVPTVGTDPAFVDMIVALIEEQLSGSTPVALGSAGPWPSPCPPDHCRPPQRGPA